MRLGWWNTLQKSDRGTAKEGEHSNKNDRASSGATVNQSIKEPTDKGPARFEYERDLLPHDAAARDGNRCKFRQLYIHF